MPANRYALIRYKTIDECLQNRFRKWSLDDLITEVSEALYEYEGTSEPISKRTIQADLYMMRSDKLGYQAPIIIREKKYYTYEDPTYSITKMPLTRQDLVQLTDAVNLLKQFQTFTAFQALGDVVQKLTDYVQVTKTKRPPIIDIDYNPDLKGLSFIPLIYEAILHRFPLEMTYRSFKSKHALEFYFYPYLLKEFNNRWFVVGKREGQPSIQVQALDRIELCQINKNRTFELDQQFDSKQFFQHVYGVTVPQGSPVEVVRLRLDKELAPYVLTKPLHGSQQLISKEGDGVIIELRVKINYELERLILGFGGGVEVLGPGIFRRRIKKLLLQATLIYDPPKNDKA